MSPKSINFSFFLYFLLFLLCYWCRPLSQKSVWEQKYNIQKTTKKCIKQIKVQFIYEFNSFLFLLSTATPYSNQKKRKNHFKTPEKELKEQKQYRNKKKLFVEFVNAGLMLWSAIYQIILNNKIPKPNRVKKRRNKAYFNWSNSSFPHDWHWPSLRCIFHYSE